ncbi:MAG: Asp-tRNA(Asn)/Glu-tRNA(Gln) amidotransferase subunit GatA [Phycisphaerae bacterium]
MTDILDMTAAQLASAIREKQVSPVEATEAYLAAIEAHDGTLHAYNEVYGDRAVDQARRIEQKLSAGQQPGPLAGVPVAIKDNLCTDFGRTTCSSKILADFRAPYTATAVGKLLDAGAVILGKTNLDEFAMGSSTEHSASGATRNPWDTDRVPGGSSGGSAAAVAARLCAAALGSDTGGSIRQPAGFCGCVGFKPTYGRVSRYGLVAFGSSLDQIGPMTRDVADAALLTGVIAGHDPFDSTCLPAEVPDYLASLQSPPNKLRIGVPEEFFCQALDSEIESAIQATLDALAANGAEIVPVSLPHSRIDVDDDGSVSSFAVAAYYVVAMAEASSNLARFDSVHYGHRTDRKVGDIVELYSASRAEAFGDEVKRRIMLGTYALSAGYYDAYYNKALKIRRLIKNDFDAALGRADVLACPVTPTTAFGLGERMQDPLTMYLADIYTISVNLAGLPGLSLPIGLSNSHLPIGMQFVGKVLDEGLVLQAARLAEQATDIQDMRPPILQ